MSFVALFAQLRTAKLFQRLLYRSHLLLTLTQNNHNNRDYRAQFSWLEFNGIFSTIRLYHAFKNFKFVQQVDISKKVEKIYLARKLRVGEEYV